MASEGPDMTAPMQPLLEPVSDERLARLLAAHKKLSFERAFSELASIMAELQQRRRSTPAPSQDDVERVATALAFVFCDSGFFNKANPEELAMLKERAKSKSGDWMEYARAAIAAMSQSFNDGLEEAARIAREAQTDNGPERFWNEACRHIATAIRARKKTAGSADE